jgi:chemotaxis protein CheZ
MPSPPSEMLLTEEDYAAIEGAVMETARGRWFLAEFARRNRNADTAAVLEAVDRLERVVKNEQTSGETERLRFEFADMASAITRAKAEIAAIRPEGAGDHIGGATNELDAIVKSTEAATGEILAAAEHLQEIAWTLRESGVEGAACDIIDQRATDIYTACSFQDITGQRTHKVIQVLRYLEDRINAIMAIWGVSGGARSAPSHPRPADRALLNGPALPGEGLVQSDVDAMLEDVPQAAAPMAGDDLPPPLPIEAPEPAVPASPFSPVERPRLRARTEPIAGTPAPTEAALETRSETAGRSVGRAAARPQSVTLADIEALSFEEKAALFS